MMPVVTFVLIILALFIGLAVFNSTQRTKNRHAEIIRLRKQFADAQRSHKPREHIRRNLVQAVCRELRS